MPKVPNVTMNGGIFRLVIMKPLANPQTKPASTPAAMPSSTDPLPTIVIVPMTPANARIEPTDKSMPPATMTRVMPRAIMLITAVCRTTLDRLVAVRKYGEAIDRIRKSAIRLKKGSSRCNIPL